MIHVNIPYFGGSSSATYTYLDMWMAIKQAILKLKNQNLLNEKLY